MFKRLNTLIRHKKTKMNKRFNEKNKSNITEENIKLKL